MGSCLVMKGLDMRSCVRFRRGSAFTLVELVIVVAIIGILGAIAVPRLTSASAGASANALEANLTNVRKAIDVYYAEHGSFPGYSPGTTVPLDKAFAKQLTQFSSRTGGTSPTYGSPFIYGPYLRSPFPINPTNDLSTVTVKANPGDADPVAGSVGWVAVLSTGAFYISATVTGMDDVGIVDPVKRASLLDRY